MNLAEVCSRSLHSGPGKKEQELSEFSHAGGRKHQEVWQTSHASFGFILEQIHCLSPNIPLARLNPMAKSKVSGVVEWKLCSSDPPLKVYTLLPQQLGVSTVGSQLSIHGNRLI